VERRLLQRRGTLHPGHGLLDAFSGRDLSGVKNIYASDLNTQVLAQAEQGIYPFSRVEAAPGGVAAAVFSKRHPGKEQGSVR
jgi:chemotaxis methyl-accepting protein methylase